MRDSLTDVRRKGRLPPSEVAPGGEILPGVSISEEAGAVFRMQENAKG
jgi:hypothetical protein